MDNDTIWKKTLAHIEIKLDSPAHFRTWFTNTRLIEINKGIATIGVKNSYAADWLSKKHNSLIENTLSFISGNKVKTNFIFDKNSEKKESPVEVVDQPILHVKDGIDEQTQQRIKTANLNERYTFANYIVGASNRLAHAASLSVSETPGQSYNPLFIYGPTGIGKTHLVQAIGRSILNKFPEKRVLYFTTENFLNDVVQAIRNNSTYNLREKYRKLDVLIIDDIQQISKARETQTEFFNTFNSLFQSSRQIVITSDRMPDHLENVEQRLISRFKGGMVADISKPMLEERIAILMQKRDEYAIDISETSLKYIAEIVSDSIRALEGALQKVTLYNNMSKGHELTLAEIARILGKDPNSKRKQVKISTILKKTAKEFGVSLSDLKGKSRTKEIAFARQVCMYILRDEFGYKLKEVSTILDRKDHTTALHAIDKIASLLEGNITFKEQLENLIASIHEVE